MQQDGHVRAEKSPRDELSAARRECGLRLGVSGIRFDGPHGVEPEEQARGNRFEADVKLQCTSAEAVATDELSDTVDYREITSLVRKVSSRQVYHLIESLAGAIASALLEVFPSVSEAVVRVAKLSPPGLDGVDRTEAEVTRRRR